MNLFHEAKKVLDKDGKVNPLGPYGKSKLTGREISTYFRRNPVKDAEIRKAVTVALDLEGAMNIAVDAIKKFYGNKILKSKEVQQALQYANESVEFTLDMINEDEVRVNHENPKDRGDQKKFRKVIELGKQAKIKLLDGGGRGYRAQGNKSQIKKFKDLMSKEFGKSISFNESVQEEGNLVENYRTLAQKGMGTESEKDARVGLEMDFYDSKGNKQFGKIVKKDRKGYTVKDDKGKMHTFVFLDRQKAKQYLKQSVCEGLMFREYEPGEYRNGEEKRFVDLIKKNGGKNISVEKPTRREPNLHIEFEGGNLSKMQKDLDRIDDGLTNLEEAVSPAQQAAIAISKKEKGEKPKNESVMDAYKNLRGMWAEAAGENLDEEVSNITVDPKNKISKPADQNKHAMEIVKQARRFDLKASQMGKHVRVKGSKKAVNDFLRIIIGKSSYGDPTEKDMSTPQIDKMLTKDLK